MLEDLDFSRQMDLEMSKTSFPYFFTEVLGFDFTPFHEEWLRLMETTDRTVIICSRDFGKSVFMHCWAVWQLCFQPPPYQMVYISSNQKQTLVHMRDIDDLFSNPVISHFKPRKGWAIGQMKLTNGNEILERSIGSQIRGLHPQEIIVDDPLKEFSLSAIKRVTDWFFGDMIPTLHHTSTLRMIGTPFTYTDIFAQLDSDEYKGVYTVRHYPCLNQNNESLWPSRWDYDSLMLRKKEVGSLKFTREYMCIPISTGTSLFAQEHIDKCKLAGKKDILRLRSRREAGYKYYAGVDPAISTDGDYNVIIVLEVDEQRNKRIIYVDRQKNVEFRENINKIKMIGQLFEPDVIYFETNSFAKSFTQELRNETDLNVRDVTMTRRKKEEIILNLQMNIENTKIIFPRGNDESRKVTDNLLEELSMFSITDTGKFEGVGAHDDLVMGLALANSATHDMLESFVLLEDMGIFDSPAPQAHILGGGLLGLNF